MCLWPGVGAGVAEQVAPGRLGAELEVEMEQQVPWLKRKRGGGWGGEKGKKAVMVHTEERRKQQ